MENPPRNASGRGWRQLTLRLIGAASLAASSWLAACASAPRPREENPQAARIQDSRPERIAAQRAGAPGELELEQSDQRWGIDAARERREAEPKKKPPPAPPPPAAKTTTVAPAP